MRNSRLYILWSLVVLVWTSVAAANADTEARAAFAVGFDASSVAEFEEKGVVYKEGGRPKDIFRILKDNGYTHARLRVWVDPTRTGRCGEAEVLGLARRAHAAGLKILLCFHYSDYWADPKHQTIPPAWRDVSFERLNAELQEHNRRIVAALEKQGTPADMAQVGNEINHGLLWPVGQNNDEAGWGRLATLLKSAARGIRQGEAVPGRMPLMLHVAGNSPGFFQQMEKRGVPFDLVGLSYYPQWHGTPEEFKGVMADHARRFKKPVVMVETSYPWTKERPPLAKKKSDYAGQPTASLRKQAEFLSRAVRAARSVPGGLGGGVFYWGGERLDGYGNQALFDFQGNALPTLPILATGEIPPGIPEKP